MKMEEVRRHWRREQEPQRQEQWALGLDFCPKITVLQYFLACLSLLRLS